MREDRAVIGCFSFFVSLGVGCAVLGLVVDGVLRFFSDSAQ